MGILVFITLALLPAYVLRFAWHGLPLNLLMVWVFLLWIIFACQEYGRNRLLDFKSYIVHLNKTWLWLTALFFLAGTFSLFYPSISEKKIGQYLVLYVQPISLFFILGYSYKKYPSSKNSLLLAGYLLLGIMGVWSVIQYLTLFSLPAQYWGNAIEPKRALGFFGHPNFYALFAAPLLAFLLPDLVSKIREYKNPASISKLTALWLVGALGLFLSMSRAGWLGLAMGILFFIIRAGDKKIRLVALFFSLLIAGAILITPNLRYRALLPFMGEKSALSRFSLWQTGVKAVKESPVLGLGLNGFSSEWSRLNTDPGLDTHNLPHNFFLDLWVENGLLGMLSFTGLIIFAFYNKWKDRSSVLSLSVLLFLTVLLIQGQVDNPYFKNDLALLFWIILPLAI